MEKAVIFAKVNTDIDLNTSLEIMVSRSISQARFPLLCNPLAQYSHFARRVSELHSSILYSDYVSDY